MWQYFLARVKDNLHTVLAFSPVGNKFRERAQKFPSLFSQCAIDWFLQWPLEALVDVSKKFIGEFQVSCTKEVKAELVQHIGSVHNMVTEVCEQYFAQFRRRVFVTPKSYLSFLAFYKNLYQQKFDGLQKEEKAISDGLLKLEEAGEGVNLMKKELAKKDESLKKASEEVSVMLKELKKEGEKADIKQKEVSIIASNCEMQKDKIEAEKEVANKELEGALPFLNSAVAAANSITQKDIGEVKNNRKPADIGKLVLDCVLILFQESINPVQSTTLNIKKQEVAFFESSYFEYGVKLLNPDFLKRLYDFSKEAKDNINDETIELLEPYFGITAPDGTELFVKEIAMVASQALGGLLTWCRAMSDYQKASKIVKPKMLALQIASA
jgi:dynein heavy chain